MKREPADGASEIESLNLMDMDVESLEERLEMMGLVHPMGYLCVGHVDCGAHYK